MSHADLTARIVCSIESVVKIITGNKPNIHRKINEQILWKSPSFSMTHACRWYCRADSVMDPCSPNLKESDDFFCYTSSANLTSSYNIKYIYLKTH